VKTTTPHPEEKKETHEDVKTTTNPDEKKEEMKTTHPEEKKEEVKATTHPDDKKETHEEVKTTHPEEKKEVQTPTKTDETVTPTQEKKETTSTTTTKVFDIDEKALQELIEKKKKEQMKKENAERKRKRIAARNKRLEKELKLKSEEEKYDDQSRRLSADANGLDGTKIASQINQLMKQNKEMEIERARVQLELKRQEDLIKKLKAKEEFNIWGLALPATGLIFFGITAIVLYRRCSQKVF